MISDISQLCDRTDADVRGIKKWDYVFAFVVLYL
jgi:hypothetical protein